MANAGSSVDGAGNLYIVDQFSNVVRRVEAATGTISTVAGTAAVDGGRAVYSAG